jgi:hypothetical protein
LGKFWRALEWKMLVYFTTIWNIYSHLWPFGIVCVRLVYFSHFGMFGPRKIWQPCLFHILLLKHFIGISILDKKFNFAIFLYHFSS